MYTAVTGVPMPIEIISEFLDCYPIEYPQGEQVECWNGRDWNGIMVGPIYGIA